MEFEGRVLDLGPLDYFVLNETISASKKSSLSSPPLANELHIRLLSFFRNRFVGPSHIFFDQFYCFCRFIGPVVASRQVILWLKVSLTDHLVEIAIIIARYDLHRLLLGRCSGLHNFNIERAELPSEEGEACFERV